MKRTPMPRRRAKPRRPPKVKCSFQRCAEPPRIEGMCKSHAWKKADDLVSRYIRERDGRCVAREFFPDIACLGALQHMHLVRRRYQALRWDVGEGTDGIGNGAAGCVAHHHYLTLNPDEHYDFCERLLGSEGYAALRARRFGEPMDPAEVIVRLKEAA